MSKIVSIIMIILIPVACAPMVANTPTPSISDIYFTSTPELSTILTSTTTPASTVTLISTPAALPPSLNSFLLVFTSNASLWIWKEGVTTRLADASMGSPDFMPNPNQLSISDDGQLVAFTKGDYEVWTIRTDGTDERLLADAEFFNKAPLQQIFDAGGVVVRPFQIQWLPGTHTLLVNTLGWIATSLYVPFRDFYAFDVDSGKTRTLVSADSGSYFYPSPDGKQIAIVQPDEVDIMDTNGENRKNIITFPGVSIYYEPYYGEIIWGADSQTFAMIIPPTIDGDHPTGLNKAVQVSNKETIQTLAEFNYNAYQELYAKISPDFSYITYPVSEDENANQIDLHIATMDLSKDIVSTNIELPQRMLYQAIRWAPDSRHYLLILPDGENNVLVGDIEGNIEPLLEDGFHFVEATWIDAEIILLIGEETIRIGSISSRESIFLTNIENFGYLDVFAFVN